MKGLAINTELCAQFRTVSPDLSAYAGDKPVWIRSNSFPDTSIAVSDSRSFPSLNHSRIKHVVVFVIVSSLVFF
jgi:hypothetical protein